MSYDDRNIFIVQAIGDRSWKRVFLNLLYESKKIDLDIPGSFLKKPKTILSKLASSIFVIITPLCVQKIIDFREKEEGERERE